MASGAGPVPWPASPGENYEETSQAPRRACVTSNKRPTRVPGGFNIRSFVSGAVGEKLGGDTKRSQRCCLDTECRHPDGSWRGHGAQGACPSSLQHHRKRVLVFSSLKASRKMQSAKILASLRALENCGLAQGTQIPVPRLPALRGCWAQPCFRSTQPNEMRTAMFFVLRKTQRAPRGAVVVVKNPPAPEQDPSRRVLGIFFFSPRAQAKS